MPDWVKSSPPLVHAKLEHEEGLEPKETIYGCSADVDSIPSNLFLFFANPMS